MGQTETTQRQEARPGLAGGVTEALAGVRVETGTTECCQLMTRTSSLTTLHALTTITLATAMPPPVFLLDSAPRPPPVSSSSSPTVRRPRAGRRAKLFHRTGRATHRADRSPGLCPDRQAHRVRRGGLPRVSRRACLPAPHRVRHDGSGPPDRHPPEGRLTHGEGRRRRSETRREGARAAAPLIAQRQPATPSPPTGSSGGGPSAAMRSREASTSAGSSPRSRS